MKENFYISQYGFALAKTKYKWDEKTRTFESNLANLVLDFQTYEEVTFITGWGCVFMTGSNCKFKTGDSCTFDVFYGCEFTVGKRCVIVRRDILEVIQPEPGKLIKLKDAGVKGFYTEEELIIKDIIE